MALTKVTTKGITDNAVDGDKLAPGSVTTAKIGASAVESSEIGDGTVTASDLASTLDLSPKTVTLAGSTVEALKRPVQDNIALLGFKMAVNDGLTVFNLVDGIVDEFHDESGTDEAEGSNDTYCASSDYYINSTNPTGVSSCVSGAFGLQDHFTTTGQSFSPAPAFTSVSLESPNAVGTMGSFTVPAGMTSVNVKVWGAGGGGGEAPTYGGGGGGFSSGTLAVTGGQTLRVISGLGGQRGGISGAVTQFLNGGLSDIVPGAGPAGPQAGAGGGLSGVFNADLVPLSAPQYSAPQAYIIAGSGGGGSGNMEGGAGGGTGGDAGGQQTEQTNAAGSGTRAGGGGDQEQGGQASVGQGSGCLAADGSLFAGGRAGKYPSLTAVYGGGGAGYYGGGGGGRASGPSADGSGGGGSGYIGHPQITSGATEEGQGDVSGGTADPYWPNLETICGSNDISSFTDDAGGGPGFVLMTGSAPATTTSTTIISNAFSAGSVPTTSRIVVFEENVASPTLNTDIIASISRDGGSNFTTATLSDSGYVTGSSGQRILTGTATISGQPSGQSMRWKLALANNAVKIHGVALQWS